MDRPVLLVEDNPSDIALARRAFEKHGIGGRLVVATNGQEALDYLLGAGGLSRRGPRDLPALVLLDLKMPGIDGLELLRRIRADPEMRRIPVVILSSSTEEVDIAAAYDLGANSYLRKPINFTDFIDQVNRIRLYWLVVNVPPHG